MSERSSLNRRGFIIKNTSKILLIIFAILICSLAYYGKSINIPEDGDVSIYNVVKEVFLTDKGYTNELSSYVSKEVFDHTNIYNCYAVNSSEYKKPYKVYFKLQEVSRKQGDEDDIVFLNMKYSVQIWDSKNQMIGGSMDIPITFTIKYTNGSWYIINKYEPA